MNSTWSGRIDRGNNLPYFGFGRRLATLDVKEEFHFISAVDSLLHPLHKHDFKVEGLKFNCIQQFVLHQKLEQYNGRKHLSDLMKTDPPHLKKFEDSLKLVINPSVWPEEQKEATKRAYVEKSLHLKALHELLWYTKGKVLVYANPKDSQLGIGLAYNDPNARRRSNWKGKNLLGEWLKEVQEEMPAFEERSGLGDRESRQQQMSNVQEQQTASKRSGDASVRNKNGGPERFTFFWRKESPFSQWHPCSFVVEDQWYNCAEQYMMHQKAVYFSDYSNAEKVLRSTDPKEQKSLGRKIIGYDDEKWNTVSKEIVKKGNMAKFGQNEDLRRKLFATEGTTLVEASPVDDKWGIGLTADDQRAQNRKMWRGENRLGEVLTEVRDELMRSGSTPENENATTHRSDSKSKSKARNDSDNDGRKIRDAAKSSRPSKQIGSDDDSGPLPSHQSKPEQGQSETDDQEKDCIYGAVGSRGKVRYFGSKSKETEMEFSGTPWDWRKSDDAWDRFVRMDLDIEVNEEKEKKEKERSIWSDRSEQKMNDGRENSRENSRRNEKVEQKRNLFDESEAAKGSEMTKTIGSFSEGIEDITECCICLDTFSNPRMLPCIHTFCHNCLEKTSEQFNWRIREKVSCPLCKQEFNLPEDGVSGIPKNFFMENLIEMIKMTKLSGKTEICEQCQENDTSSLAEVYCIECDEKLCQDCAKYHKRQKRLRNHQVVELGTETMILSRKSATAFCKVHTEKPVEMFCNDCNDAICIVCFAVNHQAHKCSELTNAANIFKEELKGYMNEIERCLEDSNKLRDRLMQTNANFLTDIECIEEEINKTANEWIDFIRRCKESLASELSSLKVQTLKGNEMQKEELNSHFTIMETFKTYCMEVEANGSNGDICKQINNLKTRSSELQTLHDSFRKKHFSSPQVVFKKIRFGEILKEELNCIGTVQDRKSATCYEPFPIIVRQRHTISPFGEFSLKTSTSAEEHNNGHKFVVSEAFEMLNVHNSERQYVGYKDSNTILSIPRDKLNNPNGVLEEFVIEHLDALSDMALCTISNNLYAVDSGKGWVWKIDLENRQVYCWLQMVSNPYTLSVCGDGRVVIPKNGQPAKVEIYASDAALVEVIELPVEIPNVFRAFETIAGTFAILQSCVNGRAPVIYQVNTEGEITHTYARRQKQKIKRNYHITPWVHDEEDAILAVNCNDYGKLFILDSDLDCVDE